MVKSRSLDAYFADKLANINGYLQFYKKQGFAAGASGANKRAQTAKRSGANRGEAFGSDHPFNEDDEDLQNLNALYGNARTHRHYELKSMIIRNIEDNTAEATINKSNSKNGNASAQAGQILAVDPVQFVKTIDKAAETDNLSLIETFFDELYGENLKNDRKIVITQQARENKLEEFLRSCIIDSNPIENKVAHLISSM